MRREHRPSVEADLEEGLGIACLQSHRPDDAITHHGRALELRRELGDDLGAAMSSNAIGLVHLREHRLGEARDHLERSLEYVRVLGDGLWEGIVQGNLVRCLLGLGRPEEAEALGGGRGLRRTGAPRGGGEVLPAGGQRLPQVPGPVEAGGLSGPADLRYGRLRGGDGRGALARGAAGPGGVHRPRAARPREEIGSRSGDVSGS
ncbi:tetratricopeptide repeat protein [Nocardiopsis dassonvillei]|uniref:tetratricopeptide repeat protein n=1 Tax=Nocardiopsis dassonvillei TaxID=2014 RepID=UPI00366F86DE